MRFNRTFFLLLVFLLSNHSNLFAQNKYPQGYFRLPLDLTPSLSGTFSEIRSNHFHSGVDLRTQGAEGKPVYAIADGHVARIRVQPVGFGKALYIEHSNGYTSVYGHLRNFIPAIQKYVVAEQYRRESFDVDLYLAEDKFYFKKGDLIAWSGNSGSSGGPHLHFEIRKTSNQNPINPLLFGLDIRDNIAPVIQAFKVYPVNEYSTVNNSPDNMLFTVTANNNTYTINDNKPLMISGDVAFGVQSYDKHNASELRNGIVSFKVFIDDEQVFAYRVDEISFDETRYVNSVIDYEELIRSKRRFIQTRILPNNPLKIYSSVKNKGVFTFDENKEYKVVVELADVAGNKGVLKFLVIGKPPVHIPLNRNEHKNSVHFRWDRPNSFESETFNLEIPSGSLYENIWFTYKEERPKNGTFAKLYHVHNYYIPLHNSFTISIKTEGLSPALINKAVVARLDEKGQWVWEGGGYKNGFMTARSRNFGVYSVKVDTLAPKIIPVNIQNGKNISQQKTISLKISDSFAGIKSYRATMNGKWILMDYDRKNDLITYEIDDRTLKGNNSFLLVIEDNVGNRSEYKANLIR